jgi:hypothetical protein
MLVQGPGHGPAERGQANRIPHPTGCYWTNPRSGPKKHYDDLLRRVTRCARGDIDIAQEALAEAIVWMLVHWDECAFDQEEGGEWHVTYHGHCLPLAEFLVRRACWRARDVYRQQRGRARSFAEGEAEDKEEPSRQPEIPAACREVAEILAALGPCLDRLTDNYRAAIVDAMLEDGDIPPECEHLAYQVVPQADLKVWREAHNRNQVLQARFQACKRLQACLQRMGRQDLVP